MLCILGAFFHSAASALAPLSPTSLSLKSKWMLRNEVTSWQIRENLLALVFVTSVLAAKSNHRVTRHEQCRLMAAAMAPTPSSVKRQFRNSMWQELSVLAQEAKQFLPI
eukprot:TRINITY_DN41264_c0_g1_i1.p3 TRINITY_DN41264_c0_g1~~TRINITY_DN41264_c0_g1_i1.p3  ORF type:complete len:109 (+),score=9.76 TRINITY_DN41264_c0_g1_i1:207-533(+)